MKKPTRPKSKNFLKLAVDQVRSIGSDVKKTVSRKNRSPLKTKLKNLVVNTVTKVAKAAGYVALSGVKQAAKGIQKSFSKSSKTKKAQAPTKKQPPARPKAQTRVATRQTIPKKKPSKATQWFHKVQREGLAKKRQRYAKVIQNTNDYYMQQIAEAQAEVQRIQESKRPSPFKSPRVDDFGNLEETKELDCQYKGCQGEPKFHVTTGQLADYRSRGFSEPRACNHCRISNYEVRQTSYQEGTCSICGGPVKVSSEYWQMYKKQVGVPSFDIFCPKYGQHLRDKEQADIDKQLSVSLADGTNGINRNMEIALEHRYRSQDEEKLRNGLIRKTKLANQVLNSNYCFPVKGLPGVPDMEFYKNTLRPDGDSMYDHINSHFTGVREGNADFKDNSLAAEFSSTEEAIRYAHYVASLDNGKQFIDFPRTESGNHERFDKARGLKIVYSNDDPKRVITMYKPNYTPNPKSNKPPTPPEAKMFYAIGTAVENEDNYQRSIVNKRKKQQRSNKKKSKR